MLSEWEPIDVEDIEPEMPLVPADMKDVQPILQVSGLKKYYDVMNSTFKDMLGVNPKKTLKRLKMPALKLFPVKPWESWGNLVVEKAL